MTRRLKDSGETGPVYPRKTSGLTSAVAGRVSAQTGGRRLGINTTLRLQIRRQLDGIGNPIKSLRRSPSTEHSTKHRQQRIARQNRRVTLQTRS
jgi:hypothetical protein